MEGESRSATDAVPSSSSPPADDASTVVVPRKLSTFVDTITLSDKDARTPMVTRIFTFVADEGRERYASIPVPQKYADSIPSTFYNVNRNAFRQFLRYDNRSFRNKPMETQYVLYVLAQYLHKTRMVESMTNTLMKLYRATDDDACGMMLVMQRTLENGPAWLMIPATAVGHLRDSGGRVSRRALFLLGRYAAAAGNAENQANIVSGLREDDRELLAATVAAILPPLVNRSHAVVK